MRTRKEILDDTHDASVMKLQKLQIELLLDIRDKESVTNINAPYIAEQRITREEALNSAVLVSPPETRKKSKKKGDLNNDGN